MSLEGQLLDQYRIEYLLGSGGMGDVYLARDTLLQRNVAIKVIQMAKTLDQDELQEAIRLFKREATAIAALDHPHILPLYAYGEKQIGNQRVVYQVMPYRKEGSLSKWIKERYRDEVPPPEEVARLIQQAADALYHAHEHQIIHQDVKPSNFLLRIRNEAPSQPDLLLTDFGIARLNTTTVNVSQVVRGTPHFMAPEQWKNQPVPATDQYALAIIAYEMLTGQPIYQGSTEQLMYQHLTTSPIPPSQLNPRLSTDVDTVLLHALAKAPEERFRTITAFARALQQALGTSSPERIVPPPPPGQSDIRHMANSNPTPEHPVTPAKPYPVTPIHTAPTPSIMPTTKAEQPYSPFPAPSYHSLPQGKPRRNNLLTLLVALSVVIFLGSTITAGAILWPSFFPASPPHIDSHATATAQANATASAVPPVVATAQANATATAITATQVAETQNAQHPYPSYLPGSGTLRYYDPLVKRLYWYDGEENKEFGGKCSYTRNSLDITLTKPDKSYYCGSTFTEKNFAVEVKMTFVKPGCGGIVFRYNEDREEGYYFALCTDQYYGIYKYTSQSQEGTNLIGKNKFSTFINGSSGEQNVVSVVAQGGTIVLFVNGKQLEALNDTSFSEGIIGMTASTQTKPTEIAFQDAKVWQV
ncbi:serine/threonine protein kinase [Thermosporothrix hazakensis]|nr:serine/threonine-protein kinase [Thermosporothrix hazakensis]BBH91370.1 hypothetical protein KTC_61210 [Thermosporothrix sp. COM3]GCE49517.1 hypothetical protein KTH_43860 [Thermosporothrix hazakensis]